MILNPMYKTADYSKQYCISMGLNHTDAYLATTFDGNELTIILDMNRYAGDLPPFDGLSCEDFMIRGTIKGEENYTYDVPVFFSLCAGGEGKCALELAVENVEYAPDSYSHGIAAFEKTDETFKVFLTPWNDGDPSAGNMLVIQVKAPWAEAIQNMRYGNPHLSTLELIPNQGEVDPSTRTQCIMLNVKCARNA